MAKTPGKGGGHGGSNTPTNPDAPGEVYVPPAFESPGELPHFEIDTGELKRVADKIITARTKVDRTNGYMRSEILTRDGFWGRDQIGKSIDVSYPPQRDPIFEGMTYVSEILDAMADGLVVVADTFDELDEHTKDSVNKLDV